ncbi:MULTISPECIES: penicillin-binding protein 1C [unclassified Aureimonas]|uniref:penicillin-binding protein 1C n=1 Tax=unclassified Aureimonas TaxID=2615206 RepID=UPI0006F1E0E4|nr:MULTISPECIES: penicillin-binding protein 1C [unclassified Aureimonas]KQT55250.1 penicillin-binding protein 1C [Aureimonas sp. Leaf427]KQT71041.1 penicillin-binding protein 1C [Aureimonas sp. Leaf460]
MTGATVLRGRFGRWMLGGACLVALSLGAAVAGWEALDRAVEARVSRLAEPSTGLIVEDRDGAMLRAFANSDGRWRLDVAPGDVDPRFVAMLTAWEDKRFREHGGIDGWAVARAAWQSVRHVRIVSGGSTLTMQVARMLDGLPTGSALAKGEQVLGALALERARTKDEILGLYLKLAPYGGNIEGIRAATLAWFGKEPRRLTVAEAALLVALPQSPERYRPDLHPERAKRARDRVIDRMEALGLLASAEARRGRAEAMPTGRREMPILAAHVAERERAAHPGAAKVRLTIDKALQERLEAYARARAAAMQKPLSLALLVSDHQSGEVLASVGSPDLFDTARQGHVDLTQALRSPGSTLKPLIYGLAFERGVAHPESLIDDRPTAFAGYTPQNFDHEFEGVITARRALQLSRNLPAVALLSAVGPSRLVQRMKRAGAHPELGSRTIPGLAIGLGGLGLSLEDLVAIYGGIANGGIAKRLRLEADGEIGGAAAARILSEQAAWYVTSILAGAPNTAKGSPGTIAHKTGTSFGYRDAWSIGYDGRHVVGVWLGRPDGAPVAGLVGQDAAVPVMRDVFARIGPPARLPGPPAGILAAAGKALPPPMRMVGRTGLSGATPLRPEIVFPPNAARIETGLGEGGTAGLSLKVRNGQPPFTWYVDGAPVVRALFDRQASWAPREPGFVDISVIDATGAAASSRVFVE